MGLFKGENRRKGKGTSSTAWDEDEDECRMSARSGGRGRASARGRCCGVGGGIVGWTAEDGGMGQAEGQGDSEGEVLMMWRVHTGHEATGRGRGRRSYGRAQPRRKEAMLRPSRIRWTTRKRRGRETRKYKTNARADAQWMAMTTGRSGLIGREQAIDT
ncbi:hypothetical protein B0H13DRAFT_1920255 [Mycena leptocephala]|nr:hypothetical protein B0H13DRAFT_1920255 [Mycena leptocephala]